MAIWTFVAIGLSIGVIAFTIYHNIAYYNGRTIPKTEKNAPTVINRFSEITGGPEHGVLVKKSPSKFGRSKITFVGRGVGKSVPYNIYVDTHYIKEYPSSDPSKFPFVMELLPKDPIYLNANRKTNKMSVKDIVVSRAVKTIKEHNMSLNDALEENIGILNQNQYIQKNMDNMEMIKKAVLNQLENDERAKH